MEERNSSKNNGGIHQILDPNGNFLSMWNRIFLAAALIALFIDPLYFYLPYVGGHGCLSIHRELFITATTLRSFTDLFYLTHIILSFRTAFILPGSTVIGRGQLVMDAKKIASHYLLHSDFLLHLAGVFPLPQIMHKVLWSSVPKLHTETAEHGNDTLVLIVLIQYIPRFLIIFRVHRRITDNSGVVSNTAFGGAAYNLFLYMLSSHVFGASWYLLSIQTQYDCWITECFYTMEHYGMLPCRNIFLDCRSSKLKNREIWLSNTSVLQKCDAKETNKFKFGIFADAITKSVLSKKFSDKFLYCVWWGLSNLSSFGQNLSTSGKFSEIVYCIFLCFVGVALFCHLIANIQMYLQSMTTRFEKWRDETRETEQWMKHRELPPDLQERIHKYLQYKWAVTNGVDEASIMHSLPLDICRNVRRHACFNLIYRVHFFSHMDNNLQDAICERLVSSLSIAGAYIIREGDPVEEMFFILRGKLESSITDGEKYGFFNSSVLGSGDYCGEELLTWALTPNSSQVLPSSIQTVRALCDTEGFSLQAADLKYVANQFKRLHSMKLLHIFRFHSHQWRIWAASYIQAAWRRFKKKKLLEELLQHVSFDSVTENNQHARFANLATTCRAIFHLLGSWRRVRKRTHSQILEMCESLYYLQNQEEARDFDYTECSTTENPIIEMERLEEVDESDRSTGGESSSMEEHPNNGIQAGALALASLFCEKLIRAHRKIGIIDPEDSVLEMLTLKKPRDPDFSKHIDSG